MDEEIKVWIVVWSQTPRRALDTDTVFKNPQPTHHAINVPANYRTVNLTLSVSADIKSPDR